MAVVRAGVSAAESDQALTWTLRALSKAGSFDGPLDPALVRLARTLLPSLPSNFMPDVYLMSPLMGDARPQACFALSARERNYLQHHTDGAYSAATGIGAATSPAEHALVCGMVASEQGMRPFSTLCQPVEEAFATGTPIEGCTDTGSLDRLPYAAREQRTRPFSMPNLPAGEAYSAATMPEGDTGTTGPLGRLLRAVRPLPLSILICDEGSRKQLVIALPRSPQERFWDRPFRAALLHALEELGVDPARLASLQQLGLRCGVPCHSDVHGFLRWETAVEVSHFSLALDGDWPTSCSVGLRLTERTKPHGHSAYRPSRIYQWHITDVCDQRCKHCYLFAEDAQKTCVTTPFDQLMRTLDEVEQRCAHRHMLPSFTITGGDPILHPRFWDFAKELHRRGFFWAIMGNPFHLTPQVCQRLRDLGCVRYQLSLDGLRSFHDSLRRPGSFDATMAAIPLLKEAGIPVQLMATASSQNLSDILACMDIAVEKGADYFTFARYCATSPEKAATLYPAPLEYRAFLLAFYEKRRQYLEAGARCTFRLKEHLFCLLRYELGEFEVPAWSKAHPDAICDGCHLGQRITIASNGDLLACRRMESVVGNIATDRLAEVEDGPALRAYRRPDAIEGCSSCKLLMWCRGCRAVGFNVTGNLQAADPMCWHVVQDE